MIVKVSNGNGAFTLYGEVDVISYWWKTEDEVMTAHVIDHTLNYDMPVCSGQVKRVVSFMNKNQLEETEIIAYSPVYIMNDQGRTVETI